MGRVSLLQLSNLLHILRFFFSVTKISGFQLTNSFLEPGILAAGPLRDEGRVKGQPLLAAHRVLSIAE